MLKNTLRCGAFFFFFVCLERDKGENEKWYVSGAGKWKIGFHSYKIA